MSEIKLCCFYLAIKTDRKVDYIRGRAIRLPLLTLL